MNIPKGIIVAKARRIATIAVALTLGLASVLFLHPAFLSDSADRESEPANTVQIDCTGATTVVPVSAVGVDSDGLHIEVTGPKPASVSLFSDTGAQVVVGFPDDAQAIARDVVSMPPGQMSVECGDLSEPSPKAALVQVVDPAGYWHTETLACGKAAQEVKSGLASYFEEQNPTPDALYRALTGIRAGDEIDYGGFPDAPWASHRFRVVRGGDVVAVLDLATYGGRTFIGPVYSCPDSDLVPDTDAQADQLATPYAVPGVARCDPYVDSCTAMFMSAYWLDRLTDSAVPVYPAQPWMECLPNQPEGCDPSPSDVLVTALIYNGDVGAFQAKYGCGDSPETACR